MTWSLCGDIGLVVSSEPVLFIQCLAEGRGQQVEELLRFAGVQGKRWVQDELVEGRHWPEEKGLRGPEHRVLMSCVLFVLRSSR